MKAPSFRLKIALLSAVISGVVLVAFGAVAFHVIAGQKTESLDTEIRSLAMRHRGWLAYRGNFQRVEENLAFMLGDDAHEEMILLIKDAGGVVLHVSKNWPSSADPKSLDTLLADDPQVVKNIRAEVLHEGRGRGGPGRGMGQGAGQVSFTKIPKLQTIGKWRLGMTGTDDMTLVIGMNTRHALRELDQLRGLFLASLPIALCVVALGGWIVAGRALRPLRVIAHTAEQVTARGLDQRIPSSSEDPEITRLTDVLNHMMDRLENSFHQATRFSADASHELKTPLAIMQGELENALHEAAPGSREQVMFGNLLEETQRLKSITRSLLLLARADAGQLRPELQPINLTDLLEDLVEDARILAAESRLEFAVDLPGGQRVHADPELLRTALMNLFVNAVKYNEPGGRIEVKLGTRDQNVELILCNTGPGVPASEREQVFTRFHRVDTARNRQVDGVGLGLSLSREIVRAHGGELALQECQPGWTCFVMSLPVAGMRS